jgi:hypothetical protein
MQKYGLILAMGLTAVSFAAAQDGPKADVVYQTSGFASGVTTFSAGRVNGSPVQGAPFSATITNESVQTLADGNRIVQTNSGTTARDSEGRTRQDMALPAIGNLSAENAPRLVFIVDPVAQASYTLNLTDKTAQKVSMTSGGPGGAGPGTQTRMFVTRTGPGPAPDGPPPPPMAISMTKLGGEEHAEVSTEDLGTQTMEGLAVTGVRTTRTIPAGELGNEKPISIVTEVWTSPDLKTIVYSKRSDPRMGEQTFKLTNVVRGDPDPSLFTVPSDFKVTDGPQNFIYRTNQ